MDLDVVNYDLNTGVLLRRNGILIDVSGLFGFPWRFFVYDCCRKALVVESHLLFPVEEEITDVWQIVQIVQKCYQNNVRIKMRLQSIEQHIHLSRQLIKYIKGKEEALRNIGIAGITLRVRGVSAWNNGYAPALEFYIKGDVLGENRVVKGHTCELISCYTGIDIEHVSGTECYEVINQLLDIDLKDFDRWVEVFDVLVGEHNLVFDRNNRFKFVDGGIKVSGYMFDKNNPDTFTSLLDDNNVLKYDNIEELKTFLNLAL